MFHLLRLNLASCYLVGLAAFAAAQDEELCGDTATSIAVGTVMTFTFSAANCLVCCECFAIFQVTKYAI